MKHGCARGCSIHLAHPWEGKGRLRAGQAWQHSSTVAPALLELGVQKPMCHCWCLPGSILTQWVLTTAQPGTAPEPAEPTGILRAPSLGQGLRFLVGAVSSLSPSPGHPKSHPLSFKPWQQTKAIRLPSMQSPKRQTCLTWAVWMSLCTLVCWTPSRTGCSSPREFGKALQAQKTLSFIMGRHSPWDEL